MLKGAEITQFAPKESFIKKFETTRLAQCISECGIDCNCFLLVFFENYCSLYTIVSKYWIVSDPKVESKMILYYKMNYLDGPLTFYGKIFNFIFILFKF